MNEGSPRRHRRDWVEGSPAFSELHDGRLCSLQFGQPQDDTAVILVGSAQSLELVSVGLLYIDDKAASGVSLRGRFVRALRDARFDGGVGDLGDGDADRGSHRTTTFRLCPQTSVRKHPHYPCSSRAFASPTALAGIKH
jgi:hypothetical protein